jgi:L-threonylcarbamoyladenylate synthase
MVSDSEIEEAAKVLRAGGLVAFPTETVYGLGASALDERAVARVFEVKGRPRFDPLIVHVATIDWVTRLAAEFPPDARELATRFWPGPLTLVLPKQAVVPDLVTAGCPTVALRIPDHPVALALLRAVDLPIAAPSANLFGRISPTTAAHVAEQLGDRIDLILDGGPCRVGVESTVLQLSPSGPVLLRPGGTTLEELEAVVGPIKVPAPSASGKPGEGALASPGMLPQHYAPRTRLIIKAQIARSEGQHDEHSAGRTGLLAFRAPRQAAGYERVEVLSPTGDLREAAANFFAALRRLDDAGLDLIVAEVFPETGLGRALNDRLRRAAAT